MMSILPRFDITRVRRRTLAILLAAASTVSGIVPVAAQDTAPSATKADTAGDIVVLGQSSKERSKAAHAFVRGLTVVRPGEPLARFEPDTYCPVVFGLSDANNERIAARMRQVATAAGVEPAPPGCSATAFIFLVDDKAKFLKAFAAQEPVFFDPHAGATIDEKGPAVAWLLTQDFDLQHAPIPRKNWQPPFVSSATGGTHLMSMMTREVAASVVVVERAALQGLTSTQIADYALMRSLVDPRPNGAAKISSLSIMGVVNAPIGSETPPSLTTWDLGYLKGRYSGDPRAYARQQAAVINATILHDVAKQAEAGN